MDYYNWQGDPGHYAIECGEYVGMTIDEVAHLEPDGRGRLYKMLKFTKSCARSIETDRLRYKLTEYIWGVGELPKQGAK